MLKHIESLRTQPKHIRNRYAFVIALGVTICIAGVWMFATVDKFTAPIQEEVPQKEVQSSFTRSLGEMKSTFFETMSLFKRKTEYIQKEGPEAVPTNTLDLEALIASSSEARLQRAEETSTTTTKNVATSTPPTATSSMP